MAINQRYLGVLTGKMILTGNTLMLTNNLATPTANSFTTTIPGTTTNWQQNASSAVLTIPTNGTVVYAELTWTSLITATGFDVSAFKNNPITFVTPNSINSITLDTSDTATISTSVIYTRTADVTSQVKSGGSGTYTVGKVAGINGTQSAANAIGWFLSVVISDPTEKYRLFQINVGNEYLPGNATLDFTISGFSTPSTGPVTGKLFAGVQRGDPNTDLSTVFVGPNTANLNTQLTRPPIPANNIFISIISNTDTGTIIDTSGTFGNANNDLNPPAVNPNSRFHIDIASFDVSSPALTNNQTTFVTRTTSLLSNSIFIYNIYNLQIDVQAPAIPPINKTVNKQYAVLGDTLVYTVTLANTGTTGALNTIFQDTIPYNTAFVPNSVYVNNVNQPSYNPQIGFSLGNINVNQLVTVSFSVIVTTIPTLNYVQNISNLNYSFISATGQPTISDSKSSNAITTTIATAILVPSKQANKNYSSVGDTITYTISLSNIGNTTAINVRFIDTIPSGTSLVTNSFIQDGTIVAGSPNPPGVTLPINISGYTTSNISFKVTIQTIPTSNPIKNNATSQYYYYVGPSTVPIITTTSTNTVNTTINSAILKGISKSVDKSYGTCGEILTYTFVIPNSGNVTAANVILRDTIPFGTSFVANSILVNGSPFSGTPTSISIGSIAPGASATVNFKVKVQC